jgi:predicted Zn finger-like uncharacterized protein
VSSEPRWATRCTSCGTSFRVTEEQLQVSEGFVRCGRCDAVFNARGSLFDLDGPVASAPSPTPASSGVSLPTAEHDEALPIPAMARDVAPADEHADGYVHIPSSDVASPLSEDDTRDEPKWDEPEAVADDAPEPAWASTLADASPLNASSDPNARLRDLLGVAQNETSTESQGAAKSSPFLPPPSPPSQWSSLETPAPRSKGAGRRTSWTQGLVIAAAASLAFALPAQWAWIEREQLRARYAPLDAWLQQHLPGLASTGWQHLEGLTVASSTLQATPQGQAYRLELVVSNRAPHRLAMPALDLSLNDAKGQLLLRRTLSPEQLAASAQAPLAPGEQRKLQTVFTVLGDGPRVSGYELGLFHP